MNTAMYGNHDIYKQGIKNILNHTNDVLRSKGIFINLNGVSDTRNDVYLSGAMIQLFHIIPLITKRLESYKLHSYYGKHYVEKLFTNAYVTNGQFQLVMIALGFKYKIYGLNMRFDCKFNKMDFDDHPYPFFTTIIG